MTLYYFTRKGCELWENRSPRYLDRDAWIVAVRSELRRFDGKVVLTKWGDAIAKKEANVNKFTLFDDGTPPRLMRSDISLLLLEQLGVRGIPQVFVNDDGDIVKRIVDERYTERFERYETLMEGPEQ